MTDHTCSRCSTAIERPVDQNANYARHIDFGETEEREVHDALVHTEDTKGRADEVSTMMQRDFHAVAAEMARPEAQAKRKVHVGTERQEHDDGTFTETSKFKEVDFSIPVEDFERERVQSPRAVKEREDVAYVETKLEEEEVVKTGLVCEDCTKPDDELMWGVSVE